MCLTVRVLLLGDSFLEKVRIVMAYAAIDTETTGLEPGDGDMLLQVAAFVTDDSYELLESDGVEFVFRFEPAHIDYMRQNCLPVVREMHDKTGLWDRLSSDEAVSYEKGDDLLFDYLYGFEVDALYMLGNSITLDRNFMSEFLPKSFGLLHYRSLDVTSVRLFMEERFGEVASSYREPNSEVPHEARADILGSLEQIKFYRSLV